MPKDLPEGKEENRALPWVFHDEEPKSMELKCIMRGFNDSNNPSDYKDARWSHPGFDDSQVDILSVPEKGEDNGVPYRIWTMNVTISAKDAGKKLVTCEWQQGDFPLSTDFKFLIFRRHLDELQKEETTVLRSYYLGGPLDEKDMTKQIDGEIKRQICDHYSMSASSCNVTRSGDEYEILLPVDVIRKGVHNTRQLSSSIIIVIIITVLFVVAIIVFITFKFKGEIHTRVYEMSEIVRLKRSSPNTSTSNECNL